MTVKTSTGTILAVVAAEPATHDQAVFEALVVWKCGEGTDLP